MLETSKLKDLIKKSLGLREGFKEAYSMQENSIGSKMELEYLAIRKVIIENVDDGMNTYSSVPIATIKLEIESTPTPTPIETGITALDREFVTTEDYGQGKIGGLPLGNLIQIAGASGGGKTTLAMKILTNYSLSEKVSWFNFEMSRRQVVDALEQFKHNADNLMYYDQSNQLSDIKDEIKYLSAVGIKHFTIDSAINIKINGMMKTLAVSTINADLKELASKLDINIYLINQISQDSKKEGLLELKHGNDAEYYSDMILFVIRPKKVDEQGKIILDEVGLPKFDDELRYVVCTKNRIFKRTFNTKLQKSDIFGIEIVREVAFENVEMPVL